MGSDLRLLFGVDAEIFFFESQGLSMEGTYEPYWGVRWSDPN